MTADCQDFRDKKVLDFLREKRYRLKRHLLFLTVFFLMLYGGDFTDTYGRPYGYYVAAIIYVVFVAMFYVNMYVLVPVFLFRSKYVPYTVFLLLLAVSGVEILSYLHQNYFDAQKLVHHE